MSKRNKAENKGKKETPKAEADPDFELRGWGFDSLALLAFLPPVISSSLPKIRGAGALP